ncbi:unnamed protein product, partial [Timema podura]|nr:unnamed protein product [Timema podura]
AFNCSLPFSDIDDLEVPFPKISIGNNGFHVVNAENGCVTLSEQHFTELQRTIQTLTAQVQEKDAVLEGMLQDMEVMRGATRHLLGSSKCSESAEPLLERGVKSISLQDDEGYFNTYAHFGIHHE